MEVERIDHEGFTVVIRYDQDTESPREWDNLGTFLFARDHRRHAPDGEDNTFDPDYVSPGERFAELEKDARIILPVFCHEHSGIAYSTRGFADPWDSGQVGWIYATADQIREVFMCKRISADVEKRATECLRQEVETYSQWANGECYGYTIEREDGEEIDASCWGFIGDDFDQDWKDAIAAQIVADQVEAGRRAEWEARDVVTEVV